MPVPRVTHMTPPPAPSDLAVVDVEKVRGEYFVTFSWTDNAPEEFITCFRFTGDDFLTACVYSDDDYPVGTGPRTARVKMSRGTYSVVSYCTNWHESGISIQSPDSAAVTVTAKGNPD